jgi:phage terminase large subunit-like protein
LSAIAVLGETVDGRYLLWTSHWVSRQGYNKRKSINPYDEFIAAGELTLFEGGGADIGAIADMAATVASHQKLVAIGIDSYGAREMATALGGLGVEVVAVPQSWKLTPAITWIERRLADGVLSHSGSSLLRWNLGNVVVERRGNALAISKATIVGPGKIDGLAATLTAVAAFLDTPPPPEFQLFFVGGSRQ